MARTLRTVGYNAKPRNPVYSTGKKMLTVLASCFFDVSEATDGDLYILAGGLSLASRVDSIRVRTLFDAAAAADNDIGFYKKVGSTFVALDADILVDGLNLTTGSGVAAGYDLLSANATLDRTKNIGELLSLNTDGGIDEVFVGLLVKTKETTADKTLELDVVIEEATTN